jgi:hypothetical protein
MYRSNGVIIAAGIVAGIEAGIDMGDDVVAATADDETIK